MNAISWSTVSEIDSINRMFKKNPNMYKSFKPTVLCLVYCNSKKYFSFFIHKVLNLRVIILK